MLMSLSQSFDMLILSYKSVGNLALSPKSVTYRWQSKTLVLIPVMSSYSRSFKCLISSTILSSLISLYALTFCKLSWIASLNSVTVLSRSYLLLITYFWQVSTFSPMSSLTWVFLSLMSFFNLSWVSLIVSFSPLRNYSILLVCWTQWSLINSDWSLIKFLMLVTMPSQSTSSSFKRRE